MNEAYKGVVGFIGNSGIHFSVIFFCMKQHNDVLAVFKTWFLKLILFGDFILVIQSFSTHFHKSDVFLTLTYSHLIIITSPFEKKLPLVEKAVGSQCTCREV